MEDEDSREEDRALSDTPRRPMGGPRYFEVVWLGYRPKVISTEFKIRLGFYLNGVSATHVEVMSIARIELPDPTVW